jgi:hypothetical protein
MRFHLNHSPEKPDFEISHQNRLVLIGSCFSENIGALLTASKFQAKVNPSGILFNPSSIYNSLKHALQQHAFDPKYILRRSDEYFSYLHHSSVKAPEPEKLLEKIGHIHSETLENMKSASVLILTFGTAYYYKHLGLGIHVANCHKQPGKVFEKKLLAVDEIVERYTRLSRELLRINPALKIIYTVSPVKYLRDGIVENNISKATLLLSVTRLVQQNQNSYYFPAYELVNDDLRDYRFYKADMAHPNEQAIDYVWQKFSDSYFSDKTKLLNEKISSLNTALNHRTLHHNAKENEKLQKFISELTEEIRKIDPLVSESL